MENVIRMLEGTEEIRKISLEDWSLITVSLFLSSFKIYRSIYKPLSVTAFLKSDTCMG